jgi:hypothetical protein
MPWLGTASELLQAVNMRVPDAVRSRKDWFAKPRQVADELRRLAPGLRRIAIDVQFSRQARKRIIEIQKFGSDSSPSSPSSPEPEIRPSSDDDGQHSSPAASPYSSPENCNKTGPGDAGDAGDESEATFSESCHAGQCCCEGGGLQARCKLCRQSPTYWQAVPS